MIGFITDYIHPKFGGGHLNSHGETLVQMMWGRSSRSTIDATCSLWLKRTAAGKKIENPKPAVIIADHLSMCPPNLVRVG